MDSTRYNYRPSKIFRDLVTPSSLFWISCPRNSSKISVNFGPLFLTIKSWHFILISSHFEWFNKKIDVEVTYLILNWCIWPKTKCTKSLGSLQNVWSYKIQFRVWSIYFCAVKIQKFERKWKCEIFEEREHSQNINWKSNTLFSTIPITIQNMD